MKKIIATALVSSFSIAAMAGSQVPHAECKKSLVQNFGLSPAVVMSVAGDDQMVDVSEFKNYLMAEIKAESQKIDAQIQSQKVSAEALTEQVVSYTEGTLAAMDAHLEQCIALIPGVADAAREAMEEIEESLEDLQDEKSASIEALADFQEEALEAIEEGAEDAEEAVEDYRDPSFIDKLQSQVQSIFN